MATVALRSIQGKWVMACTIMASAMAFIDATALNVILPSLQQHLKASGPDLFWILNAYLLMLASLILIGGTLGDRLGRKKIFMIGIFIFILGSAACGFSPNAAFLIIFRVIQGIGGALMIPGSLSLISSSIDEKERGKAIGTWSAATTLVTMGGPALGGALADAGLWRYIFFINVPIGVIALFFLAAKVREIKDEDNNKKLDFPGALSIALGLALLTFGFLRLPAVGFNHIQGYGPITAGVLLLLTFILIERKSSQPMMPLNLFSNIIFSGTNLLTFFLYAGLGAGMLFLSLNMVQVQGYTQLESGLTFLPFTIFMVVNARFAGSLADRYGPRLFLIAGPFLAGTGLLLLSYIRQTKGPSDYWTTFLPGILVFGFGMSLTVAPLTAAVMGSVSDHFTGTASGINNAVSRIAGVFANAVFGSMAVLLFSTALQNGISEISLNPQQKQVVIAQAANLGNARVPAGLSPVQEKEVAAAYHSGFIDAYGKIMKVSAGLGFLASLMALIFIRSEKIKKKKGPASAGPV
ncbi:EmrB/QacA subfamily drug resistance transporter [Pedobacter cryoconitis]|uniref:EmrB/QacA subfamily drug resistance transporter n=1 Tax=Pedobacter cryoconitis TaxID=188932 RepID=A0A7W9DZE6_9SPHI|nr:MFS transporter [Pedobacter cryoconitis]MBB5636891.1 EmrB/QacA subfamily drug resistance transporter [Pedobacter cryoconitis]